MSERDLIGNAILQLSNKTWPYNIWLFYADSYVCSRFHGLLT